MIGVLLEKYFDDLTVDDVNDLLDALGYGEDIIEFVELEENDLGLNKSTDKLCIKENGNLLNIKFDFFEPTDKKLKVMAVNLVTANQIIDENSKDNKHNSDIESIIIVKDPIMEKHKNTISVIDEEYTIPIFSLAELNEAEIGNDKLKEKLLKLKGRDVNEFLSDFLSTLDVDETNNLLEFLCVDARINELVDSQIDGLKIAKTKNNDYLNIVLRYGELSEGFIGNLVEKFDKVAKKLNIDEEVPTLLLMVSDTYGSFDDKTLSNNLELLNNSDIVTAQKIPEFESGSGKNKKCCRSIEELKLSFGDILDEVLNIDAIFTLLDKDVGIKTFLDFNFDNNDEMTNHKVAIDDKHQILNLVLYFGDVDEKFLKREAKNARAISKEFNNSHPIKTYVIVAADYIKGKIENVKLGENETYEIELCPLHEADPVKTMNKIINNYCK